MKQSYSLEGNSCWASQNLPFLWNPMVHYHVHMNPPLVPILSQINPLHSLPLCFFKIHFNLLLSALKNRDRSVGMAKGYGLDGRGSMLGQGKIFLFNIASRPALWPTQPPIQLVPGAFPPGIKRLGLEEHSPLSIAEIKNGGAIPPLPHISPWHSA
jgi:hypothetical protein